MQEHRWFDRSQPTTLQNAVLLGYFAAAFTLLALLGLWFGGGYGLPGILLGVGAYGMANDRKWGYVLALVAGAVLALVLLGVLIVYHALVVLIQFAFAVALVALLAHPHSRAYVRIYFR